MRSDFFSFLIPVNYKMTRYISTKQNKTKQNKKTNKQTNKRLLILNINRIITDIVHNNHDH